MSGTKRNCRIEDLRKIFKRKGWDIQYHIKGSEPYDKGLEVYDMNLNDGIPFMTQCFNKNDNLFMAIIENPKTYHPGKHWPPSVTNLLDLPEQVEPHQSLLKQTVEKLDGLYKAFATMTDVLPIDFDKVGIERQIEKYKNKLHK